MPEQQTVEQLRELAAEARAWPFEEARKVLARPASALEGAVIFETGYGPSGLPHIGTFGEVARTSMVRRAFSLMSDKPTRLIAFSDDMDGLRKVPPNLPNQEMLHEHLGKPLSAIPDPFGAHESYSAHNNARLRAFLDKFGFEYEFLSSTECYRSGRFDDALRRVLECYDEVMEIILPTLGEERRRTYSPFLPVSPKTGKVLQAPVLERNVEAGVILFEDEDGTRTELPVTGGNCKLQWKADWAMRWYALGVDYEMAGKDLIDSVKLSSRIVRALGGTPPEGFTYELFLDEEGQKISKSKGNGLTIEEWLRYASPESLSLYMFQSPRKAKRLYFDVIPKTVDEYISHLHAYPDQDEKARLGNPVWHVHSGAPPREEAPVSFNVLLNLVSASNSEDREALWGFLRRYDPSLAPENHRLLDRLVTYAINYFHDFVKPAKSFRAPTEAERAAMLDLKAKLEEMAGGGGPVPDAETIQNEVYAIGKAHNFENLRDWFRALYEVLLGQSQGPRFGSFAALYGLEETAGLIGAALEREAPDTQKAPGADVSR